MFFHPPWGLTQPPRKTLVQSHCFVTAQIFHGRSLWITKKGLILRYLKFYSSPFLLSTEPSNHKYFSFEHSWRDICRNDSIHYFKSTRNRGAIFISSLIMIFIVGCFIHHKQEVIVFLQIYHYFLKYLLNQCSMHYELKYRKNAIWTVKHTVLTVSYAHFLQFQNWQKK